jgi:hypothetical protein
LLRQASGDGKTGPESQPESAKITESTISGKTARRLILSTQIARAAMTLEGHSFAGERGFAGKKGVHRGTFNSEIIDVKTRKLSGF